MDDTVGKADKQVALCNINSQGQNFVLKGNRAKQQARAKLPDVAKPVTPARENTRARGKAFADPRACHRKGVLVQRM